MTLYCRRHLYENHTLFLWTRKYLWPLELITGPSGFQLQLPHLFCPTSVYPLVKTQAYNSIYLIVCPAFAWYSLQVKCGGRSPRLGGACVTVRCRSNFWHTKNVDLFYVEQAKKTMAWKTPRKEGRKRGRKIGRRERDLLPLKLQHQRGRIWQAFLHYVRQVY